MTARQAKRLRRGRGARRGMLLATLRQGLAGGAAGLLVFGFLEPGRSLADSRPPSGLGEWLSETLLMGAVFGGTVAGILALAEEAGTGRGLRAALRCGASAAIGASVGLGASLLANILFNALLILPAVAALTGGRELLLPAAMAARCAGWALFGLGVGLTPGLVVRSPRRSRQGALGGALGGAAGGLAFDLLAELTGSGGPSRLVGFVTLGACIGLATALVEQIARRAWLIYLTGAREGRHVLLHRDAAVLGRDELADVPLFGDPRVERRHAVITLQPTPRIAEVAASGLLTVNGAPVREAPLADGALVSIGTHRLRFRCRAGALAPGQDVPNPLAASSAPRPQVGGALAASPSLAVRILEGPGAGRWAPLEGAGLTLGREADNALVLPDPQVSRYHARIAPEGGAWILTDLGSTNGTRLNGVPVARAGLAPGDRIALGGVLLEVIGPPAGSPGGG